LALPSWQGLRCRSRRPPPSMAPACSRLLPFRIPLVSPGPANVAGGVLAIAVHRPRIAVTDIPPGEPRAGTGGPGV